MVIHFQPLFDTMKQKKISWYWFTLQGIDNRTVHRIKHNQNITTNTIDKLCKLINCTPFEIIGYVPNGEK